MSIKPKLLLIGALATLAATPSGHADPLALDTTFGLAGRARVSFGATETARGVAIQSDGRIVLAGSTNVGGAGDIALARLLPSGVLDASFGSGGRVISDFGSIEDAYDVLIQPDGKILVVGSIMVENGNVVLVARYLSNGDLDQSFGIQGVGISTIGGDAFAAALQADGKIVVTGQQSPAVGDSDLFVSRFTANGFSDPAFGVGGTTSVDFSGRNEIGYDVAVMNDGRILVVGSSWGPNFNPMRGVMARFQSNGALDPTFSAGAVEHDLGGGTEDYFKAVAIRRPDGTENGGIIASGQFGLARFAPDGTLDTSFSSNGINNQGPSTGQDVVLRNDGRIIRIGKVVPDFGIEIYSFSGGLASGCTMGLSTTTDFNAGNDFPLAVAIQPDGKTVSAGSAEIGVNGTDFGITRHEGECVSRAILLARSFYAVEYHKFVHPQDKVGPNWPGQVPLGLGTSHLVVVQASRGDAAPFAYKGYLYEGSATGRVSVLAPTLEVDREVKLDTLAGRLSIFVGGLDHALLSAAVRAPASKIDHEENPATHGYDCYEAKSASAPRRPRLRDPLNGGYVVLGEVSHLCTAWDSSERTGEEVDNLVCFSAASPRPSKHEVYVRDSLGEQNAVVGEPVGACLTAFAAEDVRDRR